MLFSAYAVTDKGPMYTKNHDCFAIGEVFCAGTDRYAAAWQGRVLCCVVCDGVGNEPAAGKAAAVACKVLSCPPEGQSLSSRLEQAIQRADRRICQMQHGNATMVALYADYAHAIIANVGDSRAYLYRDGKMQRMTVDHNRASVMQALHISEKSAKQFGLDPFALVQYLGIGREGIQIDPFYSEQFALKEKDCFLLCTDGLTGVLCDTQIESVLRSGQSLQTRAEQLLDMAQQAGSQDNITVVICECSRE